jgi:general secretion pathway protein M
MFVQNILDQLKPLQDRWLLLADREKKLLTVCGCCIVVACFYWMVWDPIKSGEEESLQRLEKQRNTLVSVKASAAQLISLRRDGHSKIRNLASIISQSAGEYNIVLEGIQPIGRVTKLALADADFSLLLEWLVFLAEKYQVSIDELEITRTEQQGIVRVNLLQLSK